MDGYLNNEAEVVREGRKNKLKDVEVPLKEQVVEKLRKKLVDKGVGQRVVDVWNQGNVDRAKWLERQRAFLLEYDEFVTELYSPGNDWGSALHLPVALTVGKAYHARMLEALLGIDPPLVVKAQKGANADRALVVQELMGHTLNNWVNKNEGIDGFADKWLWDWVFTGCGLAKINWEVEYSRFIDVEKTQDVVGTQAITDPRTGQTQVVPKTIEVEEEVEVVKKCFDGPMLKNLDPEDLLIVGGAGEPQKADYVIESSYMDASKLWTLADRRVFNEDVVAEIIESGESRIDSEPANNIKIMQSESSGETGPDKHYDLQKYQILEAYLKIDVDGSGINSDVIVWVHRETAKIVRATYLFRVSPNGRRPYYKIDFHLRKGGTYGVGLIELLYSLSKEIDALHNIRIDVGILSSQPFGFYRPTASMSEEKLPIEPGALVPLDNPQSDVYFPNLGAKYAFGFQEEASLMQFVERLTSVNDLTLGSMASQGATRTATGARALAMETSANLSVFIRRMHRGWKGILKHMFELVQQHIEPGYMFRVQGEDGSDLWSQINDPAELAGSFDFVLEPNSSQSNKQMQVDQAQQVYQLTANPLDLQLGLITPAERYEAIKNLLKAQGIKNFSRFVRKPAQSVKYTPEDIANMILSGVPVQMTPDQDLQGFIDYVQHIIDNDELLGQFKEPAIIALAQKQMEAQQLLQAMQAQQAAVANQMQQQANAAQANSVTQSAAPESQGAMMSQAADASGAVV